LRLSPLSFSPLARRRWIDLHDAIEAQFGELASGRPSGSMAADNLLSVAGNLTVMEVSSVAEVDHIQQSSPLVGYIPHRDPAPHRAGTSVPGKRGGRPAAALAACQRLQALQYSGA